MVYILYILNIGVFSSLSMSSVSKPMQPEYLKLPYKSAEYRAATTDFIGVDFSGLTFFINPYMAKTASSRVVEPGIMSCL